MNNLFTFIDLDLYYFCSCCYTPHHRYFYISQFINHHHIIIINKNFIKKLIVISINFTTTTITLLHNSDDTILSCMFCLALIFPYVYVCFVLKKNNITSYHTELQTHAHSAHVHATQINLIFRFYLEFKIPICFFFTKLHILRRNLDRAVEWRFR